MSQIQVSPMHQFGKLIAGQLRDQKHIVFLGGAVAAIYINWENGATSALTALHYAARNVSWKNPCSSPPNGLAMNVKLSPSPIISL